MYEQFFRFSRRPFSLTPDPDFLFWTDQHRRAFDLVRMALVRHAPIALITGEVGAGKTTLVQELIREVADDVEVALLSNVVGDSGDLLRWILTAFGEDAEPATRAESLRAVETFLRDRWADGRRSVLIVDEAQNVSDNGIETLRLLTNLDAGKAAPLSLVLVGQPELRDRLGGEQFEAFRQRLGASFHLGPMTFDETVGYVRSRVEKAGGDPAVFDAGAIEAVHRRARGLPRLTNLLCDVCLVSAYAEERDHVDADFAESALAESLATGGLGGLAAEAAEQTETAQREARSLRATGSERRASNRSGRGAAPAPLKRPTLRVVTGETPAEPAEEPPLRLVGPVRSEPLSEPSRAQGEAPPAPGRPGPVGRVRRRVWRRALGSAAGVGLAAALAAAALVLPATETDGRPVVAPMAAAPDAGGAVAAPASRASALPAATVAPPDPQGAARLFRRAVEEVADPESAALDYARAAARGHVRAAYYLAQMYETGDGVGFAPDTARAWYAVAAEEIAGARERLGDLSARSPAEKGFARPLHAERDAHTIELVWEGRGPFLVELASAPRAEAVAAHATQLTAVRLMTPEGAAWWRVRARGAEPSAWQPIGAAGVKTDMR